MAHEPSLSTAAPDLPGFPAFPVADSREPRSATRSERAGAEAFEALFRQHRDGLRSFLFRKLRSYEDAEDAVAQTFYKAWRARFTFRGQVCEKQWLYGIAARVAIDIVRGRRRRGVEEPLDLERHAGATSVSAPGGRDEESDPAALFLDREHRGSTSEAIHQAFRRLTPEQRRLLELYYFDGYKYEEISELLGVPYTCLRGRLHTIRQLLRRDLVDRQRWRPV